MFEVESKQNAVLSFIPISYHLIELLPQRCEHKQSNNLYSNERLCISYENLKFRLKWSYELDLFHLGKKLAISQ